MYGSQGRGIYSTTRRRNDDKRFQLTVRINREKLARASAYDLSGTDHSARERITGWKEREGDKKKTVRGEICLEFGYGPRVRLAHRMGIDTSAGP